MEYETDDANQSWFDRVKESPRTVSALIIILIVAAAIYAFSGEQPEVAQVPEGENTTQEQEGESPTEAPEAPSSPTTPAAPGTQTTPTPVSKESLEESAKALPKAEKTDSGYVEVAEAGDSITRLARRATARYLAENTVDFAITNEHRIYIEDYIKDQMGSRGVSIGQSETISFDILKEAVESAKQLNDAQLRNLSRYTYVLTWDINTKKHVLYQRSPKPSLEL